MDAITDPKTSVNAATARDPARRLWQAPLFVLGIAALVGFWFLKPYLNPGPYKCSESALERARQDLERGEMDVGGIAHQLQELLDREAVPSGRIGEAHFLRGTALIRLAEHAANPQAAEHWREARAQLEEAEKQGVSEADQDKLKYRLAKASYYTPGDAEKIVQRLAASVKFADDRAEGYNLLTQANLRLTPPNVQAALDANEQLRQQTPVTEEALTQARLTGGELHLRLKQPDKALKVLERIGKQSPPPTLLQARMLRARCYQELQKWGDAAAEWNAANAALPEASDAQPQASVIRYNLGLCYRRLEQPLSAGPVWEQCVHGKVGDESTAAALQLAELRLQEGNNDKALELLAFALHMVRKSDDWTNTLLDRAGACEVFERCCQTARQAGKYELALQLVGLYERLTWPRRVAVLRGDVHADWARSRREASRKMTPPALAVEDQAVRDLFKRSADAYEQAAKLTPAMPEYGDYLWLATNRYIDAGEQIKAQTILGALFELTPRPDERLGEGYFLIGESFRKEIQPGVAGNDIKISAAARAYKDCLQYPTKFEYPARFELAQFAIDCGQVDDAVKILEQNLVPHGDLAIDPETKAKSRLALVQISYNRKDYAAVVRWMEKSLDQVPATREGTKARYQLADAYRLLADEKDRELTDGATYRDASTRTHYEEVRKTYRERAVQEFEKLVATIEKPESADHLDALAQRNIYYFAAYTYWQLGLFEQSLQAYQRMSQHYRGPDYWTAVAGMVSSYTGLKNNAPKVGELLTEIRRGLPEMDAETRKVMEQYLLDVEGPR